jgi:hypothetical protein
MKRDIEDVCRTEKPFRREIMHSTVSTEKTSTYCGIDYKEKGRKHKNIIIALLRVPMGQLCFSLKKNPEKMNYPLSYDISIYIAANRFYVSSKRS